jgi:SAM-dependent methyltransferase
MKCNICGNTNFVPGPNGRMHAKKIPPRCSKCKSLERHRALRSLYLKLDHEFMLHFRRALQFSKDSVVPENLFSEYDYSIYGGHNSLDITKIDYPDACCDWIICNHVLEHIQDDFLAFSELIRITRKDGIIQINVPGPTGNEYTQDWGYPDPHNHYHYREYGRLDFKTRYSEIMDNNNYTGISIDCRDPVTGKKDLAFFFSSSFENLVKLKEYMEG